MTPVPPAIGQWYLNKQLGRRFEVVGIDEKEGTIELQDEEGFLDEMDRDQWFDAELEFAAQPESLTEVFDDLAAPDEADGEDSSDPGDSDSAGKSLRLDGEDIADSFPEDDQEDE